MKPWVNLAMLKIICEVDCFKFGFFSSFAVEKMCHFCGTSCYHLQCKCLYAFWCWLEASSVTAKVMDLFNFELANSCLNQVTWSPLSSYSSGTWTRDLLEVFHLCKIWDLGCCLFCNIEKVCHLCHILALFCLYEDLFLCEQPLRTKVLGPDQCISQWNG